MVIGSLVLRVNKTDMIAICYFIIAILFMPITRFWILWPWWSVLFAINFIKAVKDAKV